MEDNKLKAGGSPAFIHFYLKEKNGFKAKNFEDAKKEYKEKFQNCIVRVSKIYKH